MSWLKKIFIDEERESEGSSFSGCFPLSRNILFQGPSFTLITNSMDNSMVHDPLLFTSHFRSFSFHFLLFVLPHRERHKYAKVGKERVEIMFPLKTSLKKKPFLSRCSEHTKPVYAFDATWNTRVTYVCPSLRWRRCPLKNGKREKSNLYV